MLSVVSLIAQFQQDTSGPQIFFSNFWDVYGQYIIDVPVRLNQDANCFFPIQSKDCMNSASYEDRKISVKRGHNSYPLECRLSTGILFSVKTTKILSTRNSSILMMSSSEYLCLTKNHINVVHVLPVYIWLWATVSILFHYHSCRLIRTANHHKKA